jgi:hypothetical protein
MTGSHLIREQKYRALTQHAMNWRHKPDFTSLLHSMKNTTADNPTFNTD